jgi:DNA-binding SARP family transcriptional activator/tetratricopeptide (TPR) repeat protein/TolB-like protein
MFQLRTFGGLALCQDGTLLDQVNAQRKALALLAVLAAAGELGVGRERVMLLLWPESDAGRARGALNQMLHILRRQLGSPDAILGTTELHLNPRYVESDIARFRTALGADDVEAAVLLYDGSFLDGVHVDGAPEFYAWAEQQRTELEGSFREALERLARSVGAQGDIERAIALWRRLQAADPLNGRIGVCLMEALEASGDRAGALRHARVHATLLREEWGLEPDAAMSALAERLSVTAERLTEAFPAAGPVDPRLIAHDELPPGAAPATAPEHADPQERRWPGSGSDSRRRWSTLATVAGLGFAGLAILMGAWRMSPPGAPTLHSHRVVVARFENLTGHATLHPVGSMAADWIVQGLAHTGLVDVVPFAATPTAPRTAVPMVIGGDTAERIQALARETGAGIVVSGSYYLQGDSLYLKGRITDAIAGRLLLALEPVSTSSATPLEAVEALRQRVMAGLAPYVDPRMADHASNVSRTPSYEAYREYAEGMELYLNARGGGEALKALEHFSRAAAHDSAFTLPLVRSASLHVLARNYAAVDSITRLLEPRMDRLAEFDRQVITAAAAWARGDYATSYRAAVRGAERAPNSLLHYQVARELLILNRPREAVRVFAQLDPHRGEMRNWPYYWIKLTEAHHLLGEYGEELQFARAFRAQFPEYGNALRIELRALVAAGRVTEALRALEDYLASPGDGPFWGAEWLRETALELRAHGHAGAAQPLFTRSLEAYLALPPEEQAKRLRRIATAYNLAGRWAEAEQVLRTYAADRPDNLAEWPDNFSVLEVHGQLGTLAARQGNRAEAERISAGLEALARPYLFGEHTYWRARIAALLGERDQAVALLRAAYAQGFKWWLPLHSEPDLESLRDYPPFRELLRPKG